MNEASTISGEGEEQLALYLAEVERVGVAYPDLSLLSCAIIAALILGIAGDSRSFSQMFQVEHALVLREVNELAQAGYIIITRRNPRSQRCHYECGPGMDVIGGQRA